MALVDILELPEVSFTLGLGAIRLPEDGVRLS